MKAFVVERYGNNDGVRQVEWPQPEPGAHDVLVKIHAASVNPVDFKIRDGKLKPVLRYRLPFVELLPADQESPIDYGVFNEIPVDATGVFQKRLAEFLRYELEQLDVARVVIEGDPASEIVEFAGRRGFDLVMIPTHGYGEFRRLVLGSVTSHLLRNTACPVWTDVHVENVPRLEDIAFRKIVCAGNPSWNASWPSKWAKLRTIDGACGRTIRGSGPTGS